MPALEIDYLLISNAVHEAFCKWRDEFFDTQIIHISFGGHVDILAEDEDGHTMSKGGSLFDLVKEVVEDGDEQLVSQLRLVVKDCLSLLQGEDGGETRILRELVEYHTAFSRYHYCLLQFKDRDYPLTVKLATKVDELESKLSDDTKALL